MDTENQLALIEKFAASAITGLCVYHDKYNMDQLVESAFDIAEASLNEYMKRYSNDEISGDCSEDTPTI